MQKNMRRSWKCSSLFLKNRNWLISNCRNIGTFQVCWWLSEKVTDIYVTSCDAIIHRYIYTCIYFKTITTIKLITTLWFVSCVVWIFSVCSLRKFPTHTLWPLTISPCCSLALQDRFSLSSLPPSLLLTPCPVQPIVYDSTIIVHCTYQVDGTVFVFLILIPQWNRLPCCKCRTFLYSESVNTPTYLCVTHFFIYFSPAIGQLGGFLYLDYWYEMVLWSKKFKFKKEL